MQSSPSRKAHSQKLSSTRTRSARWSSCPTSWTATAPVTYCRGTGTHLSNKANAALLGNAAAPAGMLNDAGITDGGALGDNLDALSAAVWGIAEAGANADYILAAPSAMADLAALKAGTGSNVPLMAEPVLYGLPVHVTNAMPADSILVGSTTAVVSAAGQVRVARSNDYAFNRDAVAIRVDFRSGWTVVHGNRLVRISTAA
ncbi:phage major capsid protein [Serinicoccus marinus]|uniref:phage major capsid protein n=1 Tax=Serinicoccus marinus TaxID=247333 RepID=UPI0030B88692